MVKHENKKNSKRSKNLIDLKFIIVLIIIVIFFGYMHTTSLNSKKDVTFDIKEGKIDYKNVYL